MMTTKPQALRCKLRASKHYTRRHAAMRIEARWLAAAGFTLVEMLVAVAIFALMSALAYGGLRTVLDAKEQVELRTTRLAELQTAFIFLERDIEQAAPRQVRDSFGDELPALVAGNTVPGLEFTREGWRNPLGRSRSNLERVAYVLEDRQLLRRSWPVLDRAQNTVTNDAVLLDGVKAIETRFLDNNLQWQAYWPLPAKDATLIAAPPRAVEITLDLDGVGRVTRLFRVPG